MADLVDHAAHGGAIFQTARAVELVEAKSDQGPALVGEPPGSARDLGDAQHLLGGAVRLFFSRHRPYSLASALPSPVSRLPMISLTFLLRRAATLRGEAQLTSAAKQALTMLCGLEVPTDLATTSSMPSASQTARTGPPAMMPVPGTAARMITMPAPKRPLAS